MYFGSAQHKQSLKLSLRSNYKQKGFAHLGLIVLVLLIAGASIYYLYSKHKIAPPGCFWQEVQCIQAPCNPILVCNHPSPSPSPNTQPSQEADETVNWSTYTDPTLGFSFKHPNSYTASSNGDFAMGKFMVSVVDSERFNDGSSVITYMNHNNDYFPIKQAIETGSLELLLQISPEGKEAFSIKSFGGQNFLKISPYAYDGCFCRAIEYITIINDKVIDIGIAQPTHEGSMENATPNNKTFKEQYGYDPDEIMSTFKFTN